MNLMMHFKVKTEITIIPIYSLHYLTVNWSIFWVQFELVLVSSSELAVHYMFKSFQKFDVLPMVHTACHIGQLLSELIIYATLIHHLQNHVIQGLSGGKRNIKNNRSHMIGHVYVHVSQGGHSNILVYTCVKKKKEKKEKKKGLFFCS